jgi:transcriptional regulator with PAS, ATPase and Fis domain
MRLLGKNPKMVALFRAILQIAGTCSGVLIESESGTGKELVARAIHAHSPRSGRPFVPINCAAVNDSLIESELFGHISGAFSGAIADKPGLVELADDGVLFLDEVSEMSLTMQAKILRLAEEGEYRPVGETAARHVDVRLVAASNKNLASLVQQGKFRQDLYYRLKIIVLRIPPLRERLDDLPLLADAFLSKAASKYDKVIPFLDSETMNALLAHSWPGNVRELKNCLEALVVTCAEGRITAEQVIQYLGDRSAAMPIGPPSTDYVELERRHQLKEAIRKHGGKKSAIAEDLGIARTTLDRRLRKYGLGK